MAFVISKFTDDATGTVLENAYGMVFDVVLNRTMPLAMVSVGIFASKEQRDQGLQPLFTKRYVVRNEEEFLPAKPAVAAQPAIGQIVHFAFESGTVKEGDVISVSVNEDSYSVTADAKDTVVSCLSKILDSLDGSKVVGFVQHVSMPVLALVGSYELGEFLYTYKVPKKFTVTTGVVQAPKAAVEAQDEVGEQTIWHKLYDEFFGINVLDSSNPFKQAYLYLKTLDEYSQAAEI